MVSGTSWQVSWGPSAMVRHTLLTLSPPPHFCRADSLGGTWEGATWDSQAGEHVANSPSSGAACGPSQPSQSLCPTVTKGGNVLRLEVDSQSNQTLGPVPAASTYTPVPLHLGGLPGECGLSTAPRGPGTGVTLLFPLLWWDSWGDQGLGGTSWKPVSAPACLPPFLPTTQNPGTHVLDPALRGVSGLQSTVAA